MDLPIAVNHNGTSPTRIGLLFGYAGRTVRIVCKFQQASGRLAPFNQPVIRPAIRLDVPYPLSAIDRVAGSSADDQFVVLFDNHEVFGSHFAVPAGNQVKRNFLAFRQAR